MKCLLMVSSGTGPKPVRDFVLLLAGYLEQKVDELGIVLLTREVTGEPRSPSSVRYELSGTEDSIMTLQTENGSHVLIAACSVRGKRSRKRWFALVDIIVHQDGSEHETLRKLQESDISFQFCRARGPGGQNVNKRSTAVRATHLKSGIKVLTREQRSQGENRRIATQRLQDKLKRLEEVEIQRREQNVRMRHYQLQRGGELRSYVLGSRGQLKSVG